MNSDHDQKTLLSQPIRLQIKISVQMQCNYSKIKLNLSHELKIFISLYILELTLSYPQPCSYLRAIQA